MRVHMPFPLFITYILDLLQDRYINSFLQYRLITFTCGFAFTPTKILLRMLSDVTIIQGGPLV